MSEIPNAKVARSRLGVAVRFTPDDAIAITRARQVLNTAKLKDAALRCLREEPLPEDHQLDQVVELLRKAQSGNGAHPVAMGENE